MRCADVREALSARLDGEDPGAADTELHQHLAACSACRAHSEELAALHRMVRVRAADEVPDLTAAVLAATPAPSAGRGLARRGRSAGASISAARWALFAVALAQLVLVVPGLVVGDAPAGTTAHAAREVGAFQVGLAAGLLVAAWQPARAYGLLPLAVVLGAVLAGTAALDIVNGGARAVDEAYHLLEVVGVVLLWRVAKRPDAAPASRALRLRPA